MGVENKFDARRRVAATGMSSIQFVYNIARGIGNNSPDVHAGWQKKAEGLIIHLGNPQDTERQIIRNILSELEVISVLDVGCGPGTEYVSYKSDERLQDVTYIGLDGNDQMLQVAKNKIGKEQGGCVVKADLERLPIASNSVDVVLLKHVMEHQPREYRELIYDAISIARKAVIINFFQTLLGGCAPDIYVTHRDGVPYNWYNRGKFEKFVKEDDRVQEINCIQCIGVRGAVSDIYTLLK